MTWITVPYTFRGDGGQQVGAFEIDADFASIVDALNAFNPSGAPSGPGGSYQVRGLVGANNTGTPTTKFDYSVKEATMVSPVDTSTFTIPSTIALTNDITLAGPMQNGRDQAGAFTASSWIHFYLIGNPVFGSLGTLSSASPPALPGGPVLPANFTHWAYVGAVRLDGSVHLTPTLMRGALMTLNPLIQVVTNGSPTIATETAVDVSASVPPNALSFLLSHSSTFVNGVTTGTTFSIRVVTGVDLSVFQGGVTPTSVGDITAQIVVPNVGQQYLYLWNLGATSGPTFNTEHYVNGYRVANGDA